MTLQPHQHPDALSDMVHAYVERIRELEAELAKEYAAHGIDQDHIHELKARVAELERDRAWLEARMTEAFGDSGWHYPAREKEGY